MDKKNGENSHLKNKSMELKRSNYLFSRDKNTSISSRENNLSGYSSFTREMGQKKNESTSSNLLKRCQSESGRALRGMGPQYLEKMMNYLTTTTDYSDSEEEWEIQSTDEENHSKEKSVEETPEKEEENMVQNNNETFSSISDCEPDPIDNKENLPHNFNTQPAEKNHSFDLDLNFSELTLATPKKKEPEKIFSTTEKARSKEHEFATPKIHFSAKKVLRPPNSVIKRPPNFPTISENPKPTVIAPVKSSPTETSANSSTNIKVNNVEYQVLNLIGKGGSSLVYHCFCAKTGKNFAMKCVSLTDPTTTQGYINEVKILSKLQGCDKIIKMEDYKHVEAEQKLLVVLEKGGEDLSTILKHLALRKSHISMHTLLFYWMEMLHAVKEIHEHGIIHSDLKPANFIQAGGGLKLIDFGIASCVQTDKTSVIKTNAEGSCNYISPESIRSESSSSASSPNYGKKFKINYKSDVWSLGCILYQLVYRRTPFEHITQMWTKLFTIGNPEHKISYPPAPWVSQKIIGTIKSCLQYDKNRRPSVEVLINEYEKCLLEF